MGFKADTSFLRFLSMGAVGVRRTMDRLRDRGFEPIELERYCGSNKIWTTKVKRLRLPDLLCVKTGMRAEVRAKTDLKIRMSDAPANPDRRWDAGLRDDDIVALITCFDSDDGPQPADEAVYFTVGALRASAARSRLGPPKSASEGAERDRTWPATVPTRDGTVLEVTEERLTVQMTADAERPVRRQTYTLRGKSAYVSPGATFRARTTFLVSCAIIWLNQLLFRAMVVTAHLRASAMARPISVLELTSQEEAELNRRVRAPTAAARDIVRARIVLLRAQGMRQADVAQAVGLSTTSVNKWSQRFERLGLEGLTDRPGRGAKASISPAVVEEVLAKAGQDAPGMRRRSTRTTAAEVGISASSVGRIWRGHGLKPHRKRTFKLSNDPQFHTKFWDVVGLYLDPPQRSIVLCCDEKTQIQALERTQPALPLGTGHIRTETHDYIRHGTITLFAAMNYLDGKLIQRLEARHTHVEWLRFLKQIDRQTPNALTIHVIADNYATHKHGKVKEWLARHPRFEMHFTPTSGSWLNLVERFFADLTAVIRDASFTSVAELRREIVRHLAAHNENPRPYRWTAKGEDILAKISRARQRLAEVRKIDH